MGVAGPNNSVTLLLDKSEAYVAGSWKAGGNTYSGSTISNGMNTFVGTLGTDAGIIERTLTGGSTDSGTGGYNEDYVKGSNVDNQKVWPLSVDEASHLILSTRIFTVGWWLRTPGSIALAAAGVGTFGFVNSTGGTVGTSGAYRPALYLNISNPVFTGINFDNNNLPIGACTREPINLGIDFSAETVTGLDTVTQGWKIGPTYAGLGAFAPQTSTSTDIAGTITNSTKSLVFVKAADDIDHFDSDKDRNGVVQQSLATTINIPARPNGPSVIGVAPSDVGASDGKITGVSNKMEYSTDEATWTSVTGAAITGLTSGTYFVRTIADQSTSKFKSFTTEVIVAEGNSDRDGDGLSNEDEERYGTDPDNPDTDGDGISDGDEVHGNACYIAPKDTSICYTTNPKSKDTDGDGIDDNVELKNGTDPTDPNNPGKNNRGSGPSVGTSEGTAQTGVDLMTLELLALLMVVCGFGFRRKLLI